MLPALLPRSKLCTTMQPLIYIHVFTSLLLTSPSVNTSPHHILVGACITDTHSSRAFLVFSWYSWNSIRNFSSSSWLVWSIAISSGDRIEDTKNFSTYKIKRKVYTQKYCCFSHWIMTSYLPSRLLYSIRQWINCFSRVELLQAVVSINLLFSLF